MKRGFALAASAVGQSLGGWGFGRAGKPRENPAPALGFCKDAVDSGSSEKKIILFFFFNYGVNWHIASWNSNNKGVGHSSQ